MSSIKAYAKTPESSAIYPLLGTITAFIMQFLILVA